MVSFLLFVLSSFGLLFFCTGQTIFPDKLIKKINRFQSVWRAAKMEDPRAKQLIESQSRIKNPDKGEPFSYTAPKEHNGPIPKYFDARKQWPNCKVMKSVPDQASCGNNWAVAMTDTLSKRLCVQSDGKQDFLLSTDDLTRCCSAWNNNCSIYRHGCYGGYARYGYRYWLKKGITSGGYYESKEGCSPVSKELVIYFKNSYDALRKTPNKLLKCLRRCSNWNYKTSLKRDKIFGKDVNYLFFKHPRFIQLEIMNNGPVQAEMLIYPDFYVYQQGVYYHLPIKELQTDKYLWHTVTIIGWGRFHGRDYWSAINTWGTRWGRYGGEFKIRRGNNECQIESRIHAPYFKTWRLSNKTRVKEKSVSSTIPKILFANLIILETFIVLVAMYHLPYII